MNERPATTLHRLAELFRGAMRDLGKSAEERQIEAWAVLIHSTMSGRGRSYHNVEHVLHVCRGADPLGVLAVLFHDTVYCQVDGGLPPALIPHLGDALCTERGCVELNAFDPAQHPLRALVVSLFGFTPGQPITFQTGLNELASALLAARSLKGHLTSAELAQVVACIETTIPFREQEAEEILARRLEELDVERDLGLGKEGVADAIRRAVRVANRDVDSFALEDTAAFLSHTWELIPEINPTLRAPAYTLGEYRSAMTKTEWFLRTLDPGRVFRVFRDTPTVSELEQLRSRVTENISQGVRYLRQKVLSARILESIAIATGGDAPLSLFMGDLDADSAGLQLEHVLPASQEVAGDVSPVVLQLLREGRRHESIFDVRHSPVASLVYASLGDAASDDVLAVEGENLMLLEALPAEIVADITRACAETVTTRREELLALADRFRAPAL